MQGLGTTFATETVSTLFSEGFGVWAVPIRTPVNPMERTDDMGLILLMLLLVLIFAGAGFALHVLWIIAVVLLLVWLLGFLVSGAEHSWYRVQKK
jgi:energy-coupling factor transporter transmembrane protein EcfT